MTDDTTGSRLPLIAAMVAVLLLLGAGTYLLLSKRNSTPGDGAESAAIDAQSAVAAAGMSAKERAATEAVVRAYILEHPEVITEAVAILQKREIAKRLAAAGGQLRNVFPGAEAGNPKGDVTLIEFTDYSCGYCRQSVADVNALLAADKKVRVIYRELPILSPASREAAVWALAAAKQGKHKAFHDAMFAGDRPSPQSISAAAARAGIDVAAAQRFAASSEATSEVDSNIAMMQQIGFNGTPTFIIGDQILEGAQGAEGLRAAVARARGSR